MEEQQAFIENFLQMIGKKIILLESVDSTNRYLLQLPESQKREGLVVRAEEQTAGYGRLRRKWISPRGKGLWFSILWKQKWPQEKNYLLTFAAALAVARAIELLELGTPELKWPNDVLIGRKKVAGILLEQQGKPEPGQWVVAGIGLNVMQEAAEMTEAYGLHATSLKVACGQKPDRELLFQTVLEQLQYYYRAYKEGQEATLRQLFKKASKVWGEPVQIIQQDRIVTGIAEDISTRGGFVIRHNHKRQVVYAGDLILREWQK